MNKVICDVCGTDYPETAAQCPICGCATAGGQTSAGNAASGEETVAYTYVKGGRFSKSNVRKRLKASQAQESRIIEPKPEDVDDEDDEEELEQDEVSNRGLIVIVVLLLLAIIAVSVYIAFEFFGVGAGDDDVTGNPISQSTVAPSAESSERIACTSLVLKDLEVTLRKIDTAWDLEATAFPENTTDKIEYASTDESVAVVDPVAGRVTAIGEGETVIIVTCGDVSVECPVYCNFDVDPTVNTDEATEPSDTSEPTDTTADTETEDTEPEETTVSNSAEGFVLTLKRNDFTLHEAGDTYVLYNGEVDASQITWTSDDESVAEIKDGVVTAVGPGNTKVHAKYNDQELSCWVRCRFEVEESTEPSQTTEATQPTDETNTTDATAAPGTAEITHTVAAGETLYAIARTYSTTVEKIVAYNDLSADQFIVAGQQLKIPPADWVPA